MTVVGRDDPLLPPLPLPVSAAHHQYVTGNPHAYGTQALYTPQLIQTVPLAGDVSPDQNIYHYFSSISSSTSMPVLHSDHRKSFALREREKEIEGKEREE